MEKSRRAFIVKSLHGVLALLGLGFLVPGIRIISSVDRQDKELHFFPLIPEDEVPRSGVRKTEFVYAAAGRERKARVFIVSSPRGLSVLSATCSHLGCLVNFHREKREFICPCHGGRYDLAGRNIGGPPPAPLVQFPIRIENGMLMAGVKV